ncbi:FecR family protein [Sphingobium aquiterrae]|uniref:FecR family protein n=1 Tax=Sphingobium aquiterrae TaxID=2038656 RepID=UPI0030159EFC
MFVPANSAEIDRIAALWAAREELRPLDIGEENELNAWLLEDARHLGAYGKAKAVLHRVETLHAQAGDIASPDMDQGADKWPAEHAVPRRRLLIGSAAAGVAAIMGGAWFLRKAPVPTQRYATAHGEIRVIPLEDGSTLTLNTASEVTVAYSAELREINVLAGEAFFNVMKNQKRPFIVYSNGSSVRAVGTAFSVRGYDDGVKVLVQEGRIKFARSALSDGTAEIFADANTEILDKQGSPAPLVRRVAATDLAQSLAWLDAQLAFNETSLHSAALEFRRYSATPILLAPGVENMRITGRYPAADPVGFAEAVANVLELKAVRTAQGVTLSRPTTE